MYLTDSPWVTIGGSDLGVVARSVTAPSKEGMGQRSSWRLELSVKCHATRLNAGVIARSVTAPAKEGLGLGSQALGLAT